MLTRLLAALILLTAIPTEAQVKLYDPVLTPRLLRQMAETPPRPLVVQGIPASPAHGALLEEYATVIRPMLDQLQVADLKYAEDYLLKDSASYADEAELDAIIADMNAQIAIHSRYETDPEVTVKLARFAKLAEGLTGDLPDLARRMYADRLRESFPPEMESVLNEANRLTIAHGKALTKSPDYSKLKWFNTTREEINRRYHEGQISFESAQSQIEQLMVNENIDRKVAYFAVQSTGTGIDEGLNRIAILRSRLAKSKNHPTWASYQLEVSGQGYSADFRGPAKQREFLLNYLEQLRPLYRKFLDQRIRALGKTRDQVHAQDLELLKLPDTLMLQKHFPNEAITGIWQQAMLDSGFSAQTLSLMIVDDQVRPNKMQTGAYHMAVFPTRPTREIFDGQSLNLVEEDDTGTLPGFSYTIQSYKGSGVQDMKTAFHEGGHALERQLKNKNFDLPEGYGYVEIPSMTMEQYTQDPEFLFRNAVPVEGKKPDLETIKRYAKNFVANSVARLNSLAVQGLFDIELWDYDYDQPGAQTFLQRVEALDVKMQDYLGGLKSYPVNIPPMYRWMVSTHFTSGNVRYIGYTLAEISSQMMRDHVSRELKARTGRASWDQQPLIAEILTNQLFTQGWKTTFPQNIESIIGRPFEPRDVVNTLAKALGCEDQLSP